MKEVVDEIAVISMEDDVRDIRDIQYIVQSLHKAWSEYETTNL